MPPGLTQRQHLDALLKEGAVWRMRDLAQQGITAATVRRAVAEGAVAQIARGVYRHPRAAYVRGERYAELVARVPGAVICLHSAAEFHQFGDVVPSHVWAAIPNSQKPPVVDWPPFRPVQWRSEAAFSVGVEEHLICGVRVRITSAARTVVDMLRMASTVGEDRALDCLRDYLRQRRSAEELTATAEALGVSTKLAQYLRVYSHIARPP